MGILIIETHGGLAQLGERLAGSQKVVGSSPIVSILLYLPKPWETKVFFVLFYSPVRNR